MRNINRHIAMKLEDISMDIFIKGMYSHTRLDSYPPLTRGVGDRIKPTRLILKRILS